MLQRTIGVKPNHDSRNTAFGAFRLGGVTLREVGQALGLNVWSVHDLLASEGGGDRRRPSEGDRW
jgi:hypothetical protein